MNRKLAALIAALCLTALACAVVGQHVRRNDWINGEVNTSFMNLVRQEDSDGALTKQPLIANFEKLNGDITLYNAVFYPQAGTFICTVTLPLDVQKLGFFAIGRDNVSYEGSYMPTEVRFGITKVIFENLGTDQIAAFEIRDLSKPDDQQILARRVF